MIFYFQWKTSVAQHSRIHVLTCLLSMRSKNNQHPKIYGNQLDSRALLNLTGGGAVSYGSGHAETLVFV